MLVNLVTQKAIQICYMPCFSAGVICSFEKGNWQVGLDSESKKEQLPYLDSSSKQKNALYPCVSGNTSYFFPVSHFICHLHNLPHCSLTGIQKTSPPKELLLPSSGETAERSPRPATFENCPAS